MEKEIPLGPEQETEVGRHEINDKVWQLLVNCWNYIPKERPSCRAIQRTLMGIQGDQGTSSMGAGKPFRQDTTTADDFDRILWQSVELLNDDLNYQQVEEILRRVSTRAYWICFLMSSTAIITFLGSKLYIAWIYLHRMVSSILIQIDLISCHCNIQRLRLPARVRLVNSLLRRVRPDGQQ